MNFKRNKPLPPLLLNRAREMRHEPAPAEQKLWAFLRDHQFADLKFRRQHVISPYIADFYCHELRLVVELDGDSHGDRVQYDKRRTRYLLRDGFHVLRFLNDDVRDHLDAVLEHLLCVCERLSQAGPHPCPLPEGEGERRDAHQP